MLHAVFGRDPNKLVDNQRAFKFVQLLVIKEYWEKKENLMIHESEEDNFNFGSFYLKLGNYVNLLLVGVQRPSMMSWEPIN